MDEGEIAKTVATILLQGPEMIDFATEQIIGFAEAGRSTPNGRGGTVSPETVWRWASRGVLDKAGENVRLESVRIGGRFVTSKEAIQRFFMAINETPEPEQKKPTRTPTKRKAASDRAAKKLESAGV
jgi:hypothetical protein